ncbi:MAG: hypothetical protein L0G07_12360 [Chryseobacterium sp.]|nr:hypothetical protein [Chryseobacterium sp.]
MTRDLEEDSLLYKILKKNQADKVPFWQDIASRMKAFSNTMLIDFTQSLKKRLKNQYQKTKNENLKIDQNLLNAALRDAGGKLTEEYLDQVARFLADAVINNFDDFKLRIQALKKELETYRVVEKPARAIGFHHNGEKKDDSAQG